MLLTQAKFLLLSPKQKHGHFGAKSNVRNHFCCRICAFIMYKTGLDPARPLIEQHANSGYRLTKDDADVVQIIHTNAGTLGQKSFSGSLDLCINGGSLQPFCRRGLRLSKFRKLSFSRTNIFTKYAFVSSHTPTQQQKTDRNRCSHFLSVCYLANAIFKHKLFPYKPCNQGCIESNTPLFGLKKYSFRPQQYSSFIKLMHIGQDVPEE